VWSVCVLGGWFLFVVFVFSGVCCVCVCVFVVCVLCVCVVCVNKSVHVSRFSYRVCTCYVCMCYM